jgi:hypothetical protein
MFVSGRRYIRAVKEIINSENKNVVYLAVAFWGKGAETLFGSLPKDTKVRVICNLTAGGTNPETIRNLRKLAPRVTVRQLNDLHAKVVCGDTVAVIGSANCSTNGLALQGQQCAGWREAGLQTKAADVLADVRTWLDSQWKKAQSIDKADLDLAQANWDRRRAITNKEDADRFIFDECFGKDYWEGKRVFLAIYCGDVSKKAHQVYEKKQREDLKAAAEAHGEPVLTFYEQWPELPTDAAIIGVKYSKTKKEALVEKWCHRRLPVLDVDHFVTEKNEPSSLQIVQREQSIADFPFGPQEAKAIQAKLNEKVNGMTRIQRLWDKETKCDDALVVPFSALFD